MRADCESAVSCDESGIGPRGSTASGFCARMFLKCRCRSRSVSRNKGGGTSPGLKCSKNSAGGVNGGCGDGRERNFCESPVLNKLHEQELCVWTTSAFHRWFPNAAFDRNQSCMGPRPVTRHGPGAHATKMRARRVDTERDSKRRERGGAEGRRDSIPHTYQKARPDYIYSIC